MLYTGVDIIEIVRIEQAVTRWGERFLCRIFTSGERRDCGDRMRSLAARWAAKEAGAKALGIGLQGVGAAATVGAGNAARWLDLEVQRAVTGQPMLVLHGSAAERAAALGWRSVALSLSHGHDYAIALVVAQADSGN
jgi:holo-[acyl-carrier protein] synthase